MKKSFKKVFSGLAGLLIVGVLFGVLIKVSAAFSSIHITAPSDAGLVLSGTTTITWTEVGNTGSGIDIHLSSDGGSTFPIAVAYNVNSTGGALSYPFNTTSYADGTTYKIRVKVAGAMAEPHDDSDYNFTIDNTTPISGSFSINNTAAYTNTRSVTLNTTCATDAGVGGVQVAFDNSSSPTNRQTCSSSMAWTLSAGDGTKTVYMRFKDSAGNTTSDMTDTIVFDETAPSVDAGADMVTNHAVVITGTVNGAVAGVASYLWTNTTTNIGAFTIPGAVVNQSTLNITNASANGVYTVGLLVVDNAGNTGYDTMNLTWDTVAPMVSSVVATPNPGSGTINVTVYFTEATAGIYTSIPPTVILTAGSTGHIVTGSTAGTHVNGYSGDNHLVREGTVSVAGIINGTATFTVTGAKDIALNTMADNTSAGTVYIDTTGPTYTINEGTTSGPIKNDVINVTLTDVDGVSSAQYGFSADSTCNGSDTYGNSFSSATNFTIAGNHTDYLCLKTIDGIGNISYTGGFILNTDNTATAAPTVSTPVTTPTTDTTPNIGITVAEATGQSIKIYSGGVLFQTVSSPSNGANTITLSDVGEGVHANFSATFTDQAGNESAAVSITSFTVDVTKPVVILHNLSPVYINNTTPTFTGTATDNLTSITGVMYSLDSGNTWTGVTASDGAFNSTNENYTITLNTLVDGSYTIILRATDTVGNTTTNYASGTFYIDTQIPRVTFNIPTDASETMNIAGNAINTGSSSISQVEYFFDTTGSDDAGSDLTLASAGTTTKNFNGSINVSALSLGTHILYVHAKNLAGSRGPTTYNTFNKTAATTGENDGIVVNSVARILNGSTPTPNGGYGSGYHFRFNLTINNSGMDTLNFKLASWSNTTITPMLVTNNTKIVVSADGVSTDTDGVAGCTGALTAEDTYSSNLNIGGMDRDTNARGKQIMLDMFYKIPLGAAGIYSTSYGIRVSQDD